MFGLSVVDVSLYFLFFIFFISISLYISHAREVTVESYFFANRNINWSVLGISFIASSLMGPYVLGLSSFGEPSVFTLGYGFFSVVMLAVLGLFIGPFYLKSKINTFPEYFEKRFGRKFRFFLSGLYIFYNIFFRLVIILSLGNIFINSITHSDPYSSILFFLLITGIYVIIWGLQAEIYLNVIQVFIVAAGAAAFIAWIFFINKSGSFTLNEIFPGSVPEIRNGEGLSLPGIVLGLPVIAFWFWCADQLMVQKVMSARNISSVKKAAWISVLLQMIPFLIFVLPGIIFFNLFPGMTADEALNTFISGEVIPESLRGILIVVIATILMAGFANLFNSTSMLFTFDFYRCLKPQSSEGKLVFTGRLSTMILLLVAILFIPVSQMISFNLILILFKTLTYFAALTTALFLAGFINQQINTQGAMLTLTAGTIVIFIRTAAEIIFSSDPAADRPGWINALGFLEFSGLIFLVSLLFLFVFSKLERLQHTFILFLRNIKTNLLKIKL